MPVYEYQCKACGRDFEYQQRMSDPDKTECEVCGGALDRLISRTAFSLKGSGWYKDLYASPKPETAKSDGADKAAGSEAKTDGKAADKPAAKSDAAAATGDKPAAKPSSSSGSSSSGSSGSGSSGSGSSSSGSSGSGSSGSSGGGRGGGTTGSSGGSSGSVSKAS
jgi:putative FmdB family regulatory protein